MPRSTGDQPEDLVARRFLTLADVAEILATSVAQVRALVQANELRYIQIGGRQQYRIEAVELEKYIQRKYAEADAKSYAAEDPSHR
jgi:excisionase family DNA binding protein